MSRRWPMKSMANSSAASSEPRSRGNRSHAVPRPVVHDTGECLMDAALTIQAPAQIKRLNPFERYLSLWVALCIVVGVALGRAFPSIVSALRASEFGEGSHINVPIAVLIWLMIIPMMMKVDFASVLDVGRKPKGLLRSEERRVGRRLDGRAGGRR